LQCAVAREAGAALRAIHRFGRVSISFHPCFNFTALSLQAAAYSLLHVKKAKQQRVLLLRDKNSAGMIGRLHQLVAR
jgi:hypothetical protein